MGWTYKHKNWRDAVRYEYTAETGSIDFSAPEFLAWLKGKGYLTD